MLIMCAVAICVIFIHIIVTCIHISYERLQDLGKGLLGFCICSRTNLLFPFLHLLHPFCPAVEIVLRSTDCQDSITVWLVCFVKLLFKQFHSSSPNATCIYNCSVSLLHSFDAALFLTLCASERISTLALRSLYITQSHIGKSKCCVSLCVVAYVACSCILLRSAACFCVVWRGVACMCVCALAFKGRASWSGSG